MWICNLLRDLLTDAQGRRSEKLSKVIAMQQFGLKNMRLVRCKEANVKCLVAWGSGSLLLAFRGTANMANALADIKVPALLCIQLLLHACCLSTKSVNAFASKFDFACQSKESSLSNVAAGDDWLAVDAQKEH